MLGKRFLGAAALSGVLISGGVAGCGARSSLEVGDYEQGTTDEGKGGTGGQTETGGTGGVGGSETGNDGGTGGSEDCKLVGNLFAVPSVFDPSLGQVSMINFDVLKSLTTLKLDIVTGEDATMNTLIYDQTVAAGKMTAGWNGKDNVGNIMPNGIYGARLIAYTPLCEQVEKVYITVQQAVKDCMLTVTEAPSNSAFAVIPGEKDVEMGCYQFKTGECQVTLKSVKATNGAVGTPASGLQNSEMMMGTTVVSGSANFDDLSCSANFTGMNVTIPPFSNVTVCEVSDINVNAAAGQAFNVGIIAPEDIVAVDPMGNVLPAANIKGLPVDGSSVLVENLPPSP